MKHGEHIDEDGDTVRHWQTQQPARHWIRCIEDEVTCQHEHYKWCGTGQDWRQEPRHHYNTAGRGCCCYIDCGPFREASNSSATQSCHAFYITRRFITAFPTDRHRSLSWATRIQSTWNNPVFITSVFISVFPSQYTWTSNRPFQTRNNNFSTHVPSLSPMLHALSCTFFLIIKP
jgi:hypothetical protein